MSEYTTVYIPSNQEIQASHNPYHNFVTIDGRLTDEGKALVQFGSRVLSRACFINARAHGWWDKNGRNFGELIALVHSEASEALEAYRDGDSIQEITYGPCKATSPVADNEIAKPEGVASELADVVIRIMDMAGALGIPVAQAIIEKHAYNVTRPYRHGGKLA